MKRHDLLKAVETHHGSFFCTRINQPDETRTIPFRHQYTLPAARPNKLPLKQLEDFYDTFASLRLYHDAVSQDAAYYLASPAEWDGLASQFRLWLESLDETEQDLKPAWTDNCLVLGEIPQSGNYLLMPLSGERCGFVFEFEHDGFEFIERASDLEQFVFQLLAPNPALLAGMASHMRFVDQNHAAAQWWIVEMRDNQGQVVRTQA